MLVDRADIVCSDFERRLSQPFELILGVRLRNIDRLFLVRVEQELDAFDQLVLVSLGSPGERSFVVRVIANNSRYFRLLVTFQAYNNGSVLSLNWHRAKTRTWPVQN